MMHKHIHKLVTAGLLLTWAYPSVAQEDEPSYDENTRECINLRQIRRTEVVDDRNILFYMRGATVYHNILPRQCGGLAREDRFSYQTSIGRLCRMDSIRVLYNNPYGLREGNRCSLGVFHKITKEDAAAYKDDLKRMPEANPLPLPAPEPIGGGEEETEEPEPL